MLHQQTFSSGLSRTAGTTLSKTQQETPRALISFVLKWWSRKLFKRKIRLTVHFWQVHPWVKLTFTYFRWILGTYKVWAYWGLSGGVTVKVLTSKWWYAQTTLTWPNFELMVQQKCLFMRIFLVFCVGESRVFYKMSTLFDSRPAVEYK